MTLSRTPLWRRYGLPTLVGLALLSCSVASTASTASTANWRLLGTIVHAKQARSSALLQLDDAKPQRFKEGQPLPAGAELMRIGRDHIIIRLNSNETAKLRLQGRLQPLDKPFARLNAAPSPPGPQPDICAPQQQAPMSPGQREELQTLGLCQAAH